MLRRLGIRGKVLAALSVPVLVLFLLAGTISLEALTEVRTSRTVTSLLTSLQHGRDVVAAVQDERRTALPFVSAVMAPPEQAPAQPELDALRVAVDESRAETAEAVERLQTGLEDVNFDALDPSVAAAVGDFLELLPELDGVRSRVDAANVPMPTISQQYTRIIDEMTPLSSAVAQTLSDRRLGAILTAGSLVAEMVESYEEEQAFGLEILRADVRAETDLLSLATRFPASDIAHLRAQEAVADLDLGEDVVVPPLGASFNGNRDYASYRTLVGTGQPQNVDFVLPDLWLTSSTQEIEAFEPIQRELRAAATERAEVVATGALRTALLTIGFALAAVALSILTAFAIARQIVNPLRRLTEAAGTVRDELPRLVDQVAIPGQGPDLSLTRIPVDSKDEIGQLATAFNEVNSTTIQVAQEQAALRGSIAEMFVNVARRDQVLLNRQLSFIDALERSEEDPKTLADLFRLDHLATRMRRNAESLLVLAGIDTGRRLRDALPLSDVIRTASSEIEHYERVQLDLPVDPMMLGHTALPAAHMMAELLENATVFSEPGTPVQVSTGIQGDQVLITILDQGLGMTTEELEEANTKIAAVSAGDVLGSQRLGMFVVGRIAARLGATVHLSLGPEGTGTLATIRMPHVLFADAASLPRDVAPSSARSVYAPPQVPTQAGPVEQAPVAPPVAAPAAAPAVQDVAPGALGSAENPAREVDLAALTEGTTGLGLPKRRSAGDAPAAPAAPAPERDRAAEQLMHREADDAAAARSIPLAPRAEALAGAASVEVEGTWQPPVVEAKPLTVRRGGAALPTREPSSATGGIPVGEPAPSTGGLPSREPAAGGLPVRTPAAASDGAALPTRQPASSGLPTRTPAATTGPLVPTPPLGAPPAPAAPENRSAMFSGFRSRRAELAAAAIHVESGEHRSDPGLGLGGPDGAERLAAAAATASFFGRSTPAEEPPAPMVIPGLVDDDDESGDLPAVEVEVAAPAPTPVPAPVSQEWPPVQVAAEPLWAQPETAQPEAAAPVQHAPAPAEAEQVWAPTFEQQPVEETPAPQVAEQAWAPAFEPQPVAEAPAWSPEPQPVAEAPAWSPEPVAEAPAWSPEPAVQPWSPAVPVAQDQPVAAQPWAPAPAFEAAPAAPATDGPVQPWAPAFAEAPAAEPTPVQPWSPTPVAEPAALAPAEPFAPAPEPAWAPTAEAAPAAQPWAPTPVAEWEPEVPSAPAEAAEAAPAAPAASAGHPAHLASRRDQRPEKRRRRWFGRKEEVAATPTTSFAPPVEPAPVVDVPAPPVASAPPSFAPVAEVPAAAQAPTVAPVRQSAWNAGDTGAHALAPEVPAAAPYAPPAPAPQPAPAAPPADTGWAPAPGWADSAPAAAPERPAGQRQPASLGGFFGGAPAAAAPSPARPAEPVVPTQPSGPAPTSFQPQTFTPAQTTFTPQPATGAFDDEVTNMLAQRADLAQQALAELSQLSSYRPKAVSGGASSLVRRTPGTVPAAPEIEVKPAGQRTERDADKVRSLLSSFQSGTSRGRQAAPAAPAAQQTTGVGHHVGDEDGPSVGHGEPVTTPDTDLTQRTTSW